MIGFGWFLSIVGAILSAVGIFAENSASSADFGLGAWTRRGDIENAETCLIIGIITLAIGVILLIAGYIRRSIENRQYLESRYMNRALERFAEQSGNTSLLNTRRCTNCGTIGNKDAAFCKNCGKKLKEES